MEFKKGIHFSLELENAILGQCLLESGAFSRIYGVLEEEHFYNTANKIVFSSIKKMFQEGIMIDILTVIDFIQRVQKIDIIDNTNVGYYVCRLTNDVVQSTHLEYHVHIVKTMWMERELINLTHGGQKINGNVKEKINSIYEKLQTLNQKATEHDWVDMTHLMVQLYQHQEEIKQTKGIGKPTGIPSLDEENGGFQDGQLVVIGARPSVGKSALVSGMAIEMAKKNLTTGIISLEMANVEIAARLASYDTDTDFNVVYRGLYGDMEETHRLYNKIGSSTSTLPIFVTDKTRVNISEIRAKAEKLKSLNGLGCLIIDYLQLVTPIGGSYNKNRENEIAEMSRGCKIMAKELNIPVILLCQLNREVTKRRGQERYPQLSDLRESGAIEQDADIVLFLHRDWMSGFQVDENGNSTEDQADLVVRKWRNGKSNFIIPLKFYDTKMKFVERNNMPDFKSHAPKNFYEKEDKDEAPF